MTTVDPTSRLYFRQLLCGLDIAADDPVAQQMVNFVYLIGDRQTGEAVAVDPAYDIAGVLEVSRPTTCAWSVPWPRTTTPITWGVTSWATSTASPSCSSVNRCPSTSRATRSPWVVRATGVADTDLVAHESGDVLHVGQVPITLIHTPGHTPGSQCFLVDDQLLVSGDTLFLDGCGRTDLPGGDPELLYESLTQKLDKIPDDAVLFPGHLYSEKPSATMAETRARNVVFRPQSLDQWLMMFGR